jgi:hypothetical protein
MTLVELLPYYAYDSEGQPHRIDTEELKDGRWRATAIAVSTDISVVHEDEWEASRLARKQVYAYLAEKT